MVITEDLGAQGEYADQPAEVQRVVLERGRWSNIADEVKRVFNQRLKERGLDVGRWKVGQNYVDRLLGKELLVLAWAIEHAESAEIPVAVRNWLALRPEERWWLYGATAASTGEVDDGHRGWRLALRNALAESPHGNAAAITPERKDAMPEPLPQPLSQKQK